MLLLLKLHCDEFTKQDDGNAVRLLSPPGTPIMLLLVQLDAIAILPLKRTMRRPPCCHHCTWGTPSSPPPQILYPAGPTNAFSFLYYPSLLHVEAMQHQAAPPSLRQL